MGPLVGGLLTTFVTWRLVLLINVPMMIVLAAMVIVFVEESRDETVSKQIDYAASRCSPSACSWRRSGLTRRNRPGGFRPARWCRSQSAFC